MWKIAGIEGIFNVYGKHDQDAFGSALSFQETLQVTQLALGAAVFTKSLLSIFKELMIFEEAHHPPVDESMMISIKIANFAQILATGRKF